MKIEFTVPGEPIPQPRVTPGRTWGGRRNGYVPTDHPVHAWRAKVRWKAREAMRGTPRTARGLLVAIEFVMPRPKAIDGPRQRLEEREVDVRPDLDNLLKSTLDAIDCAWEDDGQVTTIATVKRYTVGDEHPHAHVRIMERPGFWRRLWAALVEQEEVPFFP